jgi:hypothetical protein
MNRLPEALLALALLAGLIGATASHLAEIMPAIQEQLAALTDAFDGHQAEIDLLLAELDVEA